MQLKSTIFPETEVQVFITGRAGRLEVKLIGAKAGKSRVCVVICHPHPLYGGNMENKVVTTVFRAFQAMGATVVRFNYRGVGQSEGSYGDAVGETDDLISVCEWLRQKDPNLTLWLVGFSFGCYIAARAANELHAQQLITIAPPVHHFNFDAIDFPKCPWVLLQGDQDEVVSPKLVYDWVAKQTQFIKVIPFPETSHFFHGKLIDLKSVLHTEFIRDFQ